MIIRLVTADESKPFLELIHLAYQSVNKLGIHFAAGYADSVMVDEHLSCNAAYVIEQEGQFIATISLRFPWGNNSGPFGLPHLGWFATHPDYKQQGFGQKLISWVENNILINQLKLPAVTLGTASNHPWLVQFYQQQGFKAIAKANLGRGHITIYMEKVLNEKQYTLWQKQQITSASLKKEQIQIERITE